MIGTRQRTAKCGQPTIKLVFTSSRYHLIFRLNLHESRISFFILRERYPTGLQHVFLLFHLDITVITVTMFADLADIVHAGAGDGVDLAAEDGHLALLVADAELGGGPRAAEVRGEAT